MIDQLAEKFRVVQGAEVELADVKATASHLDVLVPAAGLRDLTHIVRDADFIIESVTAIDTTPQMMALYHFSHPDRFCRVTARVLLDRESPSCPTISDIYPGANWHERETDDFFGIDFEGHPDKTPRILPEDAGDLNPLLREGKRLKELGKVLPRFAAPEPEPTPEPESAPEPAPESEG